MSTQRIVPCLWFDNEAEDAAKFYIQTFVPGGGITARSYYPQSIANPGAKPPGSLLTVQFEVAGQSFTALNGGPQFHINQNISFFVHVETADAAGQLFDKLAVGGSVLMPLAEYPWSTRYGWVKDRFGVSWQVITNPRNAKEPVIVPCLMFSDALRGQAEAAIATYAAAFLRGGVIRLERYSKTEGAEGNIKHGRFLINGQEFVAMDSPVNHGTTFNEGLSLQVRCNDQAEVDHYSSVLAQGGEQGRCGWLKDRFGLSWQVAPRQMSEWMTSRDSMARDRVFAAMLSMKKLDIAQLQAAFDAS